MPKNATLQATPEILDILRRSSRGSEGITLPQQLDRKVYEAVNKFLMAAGCNWSKSKKYHVFESEAAFDKLEALLTTGEVRDDKKHFQSFYSPPAVVDALLDCFDGDRGLDWLEPSCGTGNIAVAIAGRYSPDRLECYEIDATAGVECTTRLAGIGKPLPASLGLYIGNDFLEVGPPANQFTTFDRVVMNPPFANGAAMRHVLHAWKFLRPGGWLVSVMPGTYKDYKSGGRTKLGKAFHAAVGALATVTDLPANSFGASGTGVNTCMLAVEKPA